MKLTDFQHLADLVAAKTEETPSLEFKRKPSPGIELQKDDKRLIGESVSGFANAVGGTLIIGVGTEKHQGLDRAAALHEIEHVELVAARYAAYVRECADPPVEGIEITPVISAEGRGLIVMTIPRGQRRPHMCRAPERHTYYRRVMDSFVPMEAYEVEEMMRLKTSPVLEFVSELRRAGSMGDNRQLDILFGLKNTSRVTAKFPYIEYSREPGQPPVAEFGLDGNGRTLWPKIALASPIALFAAGSDEVLHPGQSLFVSKLQLCEVDRPDYPKYWGFSQLSEDQVLSLKFNYGCEDTPQATAELRYKKSELSNIVRP